MKFLFILACALTTACSAADAGWKMFDRRVGMFVHWGVYASLGYHEQARMRLFMPRDEYAKKALPGFTADKFRGDDLVDAAESLGAEYIVVTTKHHDGFCLWDTKATDFNAVKSPAGRDMELFITHHIVEDIGIDARGVDNRPRPESFAVRKNRPRIAIPFNGANLGVKAELRTVCRGVFRKRNRQKGRTHDSARRRLECRNRVIGNVRFKGTKPRRVDDFESLHAVL